LSTTCWRTHEVKYGFSVRSIGGFTSARIGIGSAIAAAYCDWLM
jgi:hypothetical protein